MMILFGSTASTIRDVLLVIGMVAAFIIYETLKSPETKQREAEQLRLKRTPISQLGRQTHGGLACPKCGGTQFKARRSGGARAGIVATGLVGLAFTKQTKVACTTCGTIYQRG